MQSNVFCVIQNVSLMTEMKKTGIGLSFVNRFGMKDINHASLCAVIPRQPVAFGFTFQSTGNNTLSEKCLGLSFAHAPFKQISFGISARYQTLSIRGYGHQSHITSDIALTSHLNDKFSSSCRILNLVGSNFSLKHTESFSRTFSLGWRYQFNKKVRLNCEAEKCASFKTNIKTGIVYQVNQLLRFNIGFSSLQAQCTFGFSLKRKQYLLEFATGMVQMAGISTNLSFSYEIGQ